jgi:hypothetical protein
MTPKWEDARDQVDAYLKGTAGIGATAGFKSVRSELPEQASLLMLFSAQSLAGMMATQFATMFNNPNLKVPGDLAKEPALLGVSLTPRPPVGYEFHLVVPASVGVVIDKALLPLFRAVQGGAVNP